jgi:crotonobetainyl-CoA:carnitine CoA-transferase CaiB-like acyl-CoA transferase
MNPLDGLRVVDFSHAISGPTCTNMLVQLGAEVIKVEPPGRGDGFRHYTEHGGEPFLSIPFASINAGKRSIVLDLKQSDGQRIARQLIGRADVLVENFRPGVLARLDLAPDDLRATDPALIIVSITGFGQDGPLAQYGAYDHIAQAISGIALLNTTEQGPLKVGIPIIDSFAGYLAVIALFAALRTRDQTGQGTHCDIAMLDAALKLVNSTVAIQSATGRTPGGTGNRGFRLVATSEFFPVADGWIALGANEQGQVEALFRILGAPEMLDDPRFSTHAARVEHYGAVRAWLAGRLASWAGDELEARLTAARVPAAKLRSVGEIASHPHVRRRGVLEPVRVPGQERPLDVVGPGFATDRHGLPAVPRIGADTDSVLGDLGLDGGAIAVLRQAGVVA